MTKGLPLSHVYNLARLGNAGDAVHFAADTEQRGAIAKWSGIVSVEKFEAGVEIQKLAPNRFALAFRLSADVTQACVVTLEPVSSHMERSFTRELMFVGSSRHRDAESGSDSGSGPEVVLDSALEEGPEEIESLHFDLAMPVLEEFVLSLDPYPRRPGVEFAVKNPESTPPDSPFAVLKGLK
jgi:uncharacterized metal-binding protein YceD (DUF177 family)